MAVEPSQVRVPALARGSGQSGSYRPVFESPAQIIAAALLAGVLVGFVLSRDVQLGVALLMGILYLPLALLNLPLAIVLWIPLTYLESWSAARFVPLGVALLLGLAWLGALGGRSTMATAVFRRHRGTFLLLALFLAWLTLSVAWASDTGAGAREIWGWYVSAAVLVVIATTLSTSRDLVGVCVAFVIAGLIAIAIAVPQLAPAGAQSEEAARLGGSLQNPNYLASGLLSAMVLAVGLTSVLRRLPWRLLLAAAVFVVICALLLTGSRGGLVAALTAALAALVLMRGRRLQVIAMLSVVGVAGGFLLAATSQQSLDRIRQFDEGGTGRVDLWAVALDMAEDDTLTGVGLNNFRTEAPEHVSEVGRLERADLVAETPKLVHNAYLEFLAETGVIGLGLFLLLMLALLRATWSGAKQLDACGEVRLAALARGILIAQIGSLVALFFLSNPGNSPLWILLALGPFIGTIAERVRAGASHA